MPVNSSVFTQLLKVSELLYVLVSFQCVFCSWKESCLNKTLCHSQLMVSGQSGVNTTHAAKPVEEDHKPDAEPATTLHQHTVERIVQENPKKHKAAIHRVVLVNDENGLMLFFYLNTKYISYTLLEHLTPLML